MKARILLKADTSEAGEAWSDAQIVERFEWHYTPKHGSWLDMAESELGILSSQCLDRRIPDKAALSRSPRGRVIATSGDGCYIIPVSLTPSG